MPVKKRSSEKTRRWHRKSKGGCHECKRRRRKVSPSSTADTKLSSPNASTQCDEKAPSCTRCVSGFLECIYPSRNPSTTFMSVDQPLIQVLSTASDKPYWSAPEPSEEFPISRYLDRALSYRQETSMNGHTTSFLTDAYLCQYYLFYLCPNLNISQDDSTSQSGPLEMPSSALQSEAVYHSLLAVSAVRMAWDMIFKSPYSKASAVYQVLLCGYQHLSQASDRMRKTLSDSESTDLESLITSTLILLPFAAASQQIDHWISSRSKTGRSSIRLSSNPRDMITFVRGMRGMLEMLPPNLPVMGHETLANISQGLNKAVRTAIDSPGSSASSASKTITFGSRQALIRLGVRLNSLCSECNDPLNHELIACKKAFEVLEQIRDSVEAVLESSKPGYLSPRISIPSRSPSWLQSFIRLPCKLEGTTLLPHDPLTRLLLSFYAQVPQQYLDLVLPLLDQRLETPADPFTDCLALSLSRTQAFALDVYAHWSVLMSLVEEQSWWIGRLPVTTLDGAVNRYGTAFVRRLWPECGEQEEWWPGEMLRVLRNAEKMVLEGVEKDN